MRTEMTTLIDKLTIANIPFELTTDCCGNENNQIWYPSHDKSVCDVICHEYSYGGTKGLLEMMGSRLEVESTYGFGSTFSFRLKQKVMEWKPLGNYEEAWKSHVSSRSVYHQQFTAPSARVLAVDDNEMNLAVFVNLLKKTELKIDTALSGSECLALAEKNKYDVIFLDHMMPEKDGIETLHELRSRSENPNLQTPVICLTANAVSGAKEEYMDAGFDDYLAKPIDSNRLEELLKYYLPANKVNNTGETEEVFGTNGGIRPSVPDELRPLKEVGIDVEQMILNTGDEKAFLSLLQMFSDTLDDKAGEIDMLFSREEYKDYTIKVHAIKSSLRLIGDDILADYIEAYGEITSIGNTSRKMSFEDSINNVAGNYSKVEDRDKQDTIREICTEIKLIPEKENKTKMYKIMIKYLKEEGISREYFYVGVELCKLYSMTKQFDELKKFLPSLMKDVDKYQDKEMVKNIKLELIIMQMQIFKHEGNTIEIKSLYLEANKLMKDQVFEDKFLVAIIEEEGGKIAMRQKDFNKALEKFKFAFHYYRDMGNEEEAVTVLKYAFIVSLLVPDSGATVTKEETKIYSKHKTLMNLVNLFDAFHELDIKKITNIWKKDVIPNEKDKFILENKDDIFYNIRMNYIVRKLKVMKS